MSFIGVVRLDKSREVLCHSPTVSSESETMDDIFVKELQGKEPGEAVISALRKLLTRDSYLLEVDANERSITHRLGLYLQEKFPNFNVDCEYNRDDVEPKKIGHLGLYPDDEDTDAKTVFPDIIVHKRGTKENYLVIEVKKSTNHVSREADYAKLRGYKRTLGFEFALFVELGTLRQSAVTAVEWL